jgi:hypothetical protein
LFLAMVRQQAGQLEQARAWFQKAALADLVDCQERLLFCRLRQEAAKVIGINP